MRRTPGSARSASSASHGRERRGPGGGTSGGRACPARRSPRVRAGRARTARGARARRGPRGRAPRLGRGRPGGYPARPSSLRAASTLLRRDGARVRVARARARRRDPRPRSAKPEGSGEPCRTIRAVHCRLSCAPDESPKIPRAFPAPVARRGVRPRRGGVRGRRAAREDRRRRPHVPADSRSSASRSCPRRRASRTCGGRCATSAPRTSPSTSSRPRSRAGTATSSPPFSTP